MKAISLFFIGLFTFSLILFSFLFFHDFVKSGMVVVSLVSPIVALYYLFFLKEKNVFLSLFLVFCSLSNINLFTTLVRPFGIDLDEILSVYWNYFIINGLLILAYSCFMLRIISKTNVKLVWKKFKYHIIVLTVLGFYVVYVFVISVIVADTFMYVFDIVYNVFLVILFSMSLINYFYHENKKAFFLFLGVMLILFEEVFGIVYAYLNRELGYALIWITLYVASFYFIIAQSQMETKEKPNFLDLEEVD